MRWRVAVSMALILALLVGGVFCRIVVEQHCRAVEELLQSWLSGDHRQLARARGLWEKRLGLLSALIDHEKLEKVGEGLARAEGQFSAGETAAAADQIRMVLYLLGAVREYDHINLKNLF